MNKFIKLTTVVAAALVAMPVMAQNVQSPSKGLYRLIDNSDGYFNVRDNVVMIEGEDDIKACRFGLTPEFFAAYGAGDAAGIEANQPEVVCASITEFNVVDTAAEINDTAELYNFIDNSEAYVNVTQNIVMIEGESDIEFCHFDLSDEYFAAVAGKDDAAMAANQPVVTCVPFADVSK
ncbi:hypothetical protein [Profundibacter sp.]|uniref:hypothetical protein n=1 Tax=Profundibacter sp. TaxID=3101071 RepID=UPI003D14CE9B